MDHLCIWELVTSLEIGNQCKINKTSKISSFYNQTLGMIYQTHGHGERYIMGDFDWRVVSSNPRSTKLPLIPVLLSCIKMRYCKSLDKGVYQMPLM